MSKGHMVKEEPQQAGRHQLDSGQRRALLGEDALQGKRWLKNEAITEVQKTTNEENQKRLKLYVVFLD